MLRLHLHVHSSLKELDQFQFVVLAHNIGWQIYWLFSDDQRIKSIEGQVTEAGASGSDLVSSAAPAKSFRENRELFCLPNTNSC